MSGATLVERVERVDVVVRIFSVKPALKKVSKYDNKFKKLGGGEKAPGAKEDFRAQLKNVKREDISATLDKKASFSAVVVFAAL